MDSELCSRSLFGRIFGPQNRQSRFLVVSLNMLQGPDRVTYTPISRAMITRIISLVPSNIRCTRKSRTMRSTG